MRLVTGVCGVLRRSGALPALIERVIDQTKRRVLEGEKVPASEKLVSLFEEHTNIIVKGSRDVQYGHKLNRQAAAVAI